MKALAWSVRRELWEHRSLTIAPLAIAVLVLAGFVMTATGLEMARRIDSIDPAKQAALLSRPYEGAAIILVATSFVVALFYCLDALHGERRDRSILFWKSLPVSDRLAVLGKALVPLVVVPAITFIAVIVTQLAMLLVGSAMLSWSGGSAAPLWTQVPHLRNVLGLVYTLIAMALWHAPLYAWCLAASSCAPRAPMLFAALPWVALAMIEIFVFGSQGVLAFIRARFVGVFDVAFAHVKPPGGDVILVPPQAVPDPLHFFATPGLWGGLAAAALLVAIAIAFRRRALA